VGRADDAVGGAGSNLLRAFLARTAFSMP